MPIANTTSNLAGMAATAAPIAPLAGYRRLPGATRFRVRFA
jgi:hypothetical protein